MAAAAHQPETDSDTEEDQEQAQPRQAAREQSGKRVRYSAETYTRLIEAYRKDEDIGWVASVLKIKPASARTIIMRYKKGGDTAPKRRGGPHNNPFNKPAILAAIREFYADSLHSDATLSELQTHLLSGENARLLPLKQNGERRPVSVATLCKWLNNELFLTLKVATPDPSARNTAALKEARHRFVEWLCGIYARRLIFIDEHGFNLWTRRSRGRGPIGYPARVPVAIQKMLNCTVAGCVTATGKLLMRPYFGGFTGDTILEFVREACALWSHQADESIRGAGCVVILDNCPSHTREVMGRACTAPNSCEFLPAYSPQLNIIENVFCMHKAHIRALHAEHRAEIIAIDTAPRGERTRARKAMLETFCVDGWVRIHDSAVANSWGVMHRIIPACLSRQNI